jgi:hypothetical protein
MQELLMMFLLVSTKVIAAIAFVEIGYGTNSFNTEDFLHKHYISSSMFGSASRFGCNLEITINRLLAKVSMR